MAQYKVPQDVEADDKLLGPFTFRQFLYLLIAAGLIAIAVLLFKVFPLLAIIPLPPVLLLLALSLPLKKDQPMETYLAALVSYYLKPRTRIWNPGQAETTIRITAPKIIEDSRTRNISGEEATHRLSFLADIVDSGGYAIKGASSSPMRDDLVAEANATQDMFENYRFDNLSSTISRGETAHHKEVVQEMRNAIERSNSFTNPDAPAPTIVRRSDERQIPTVATPYSLPPVSNNRTAHNSIYDSPSVVRPDTATPTTTKPPIPPKPTPTKPPKPSIIELANNPDFSVATIAKEANRINRKDDGEVFISLH